MCDEWTFCVNDIGELSYDLTPSRAGPLVDAGIESRAWASARDFMGIKRDRAPDVGAFELTSGGVMLEASGPRPPRVSGEDVWQ